MHNFGLVLVDKESVENELFGGCTDAERAVTPTAEEIYGHVTMFVEGMMEQYSESYQVEEYEKDCDCVGDIALLESGQFKRTFCAEMPEHKQLKAQDDFIKNHPMHNKPNPDCDYCEGKGVYMSTDNPNGQFDWFVIGGRWAGALNPDYDASKDPRNFEPCTCANPPDPTCYKCKGTGTARSWSNAAVYDGDVRLASEAFAVLKDDEIPCSIVTPDGEWQDVDEDSWEEIVRLFGDTTYAVVVDYHY